MKLTIQLYTQTVFHVHVNPNDRVLDVINKIHTTCPRRLWYLRFNGNVLDRSHTLSECKIADGCTLTIVCRIRVFVVGDSYRDVRDLIYAYTNPNPGSEYQPVSFESTQTSSLVDGQQVEITWMCSADLQVSYLL
jgi:hypothetical protein